MELLAIHCLLQFLVFIYIITDRIYISLCSSISDVFLLFASLTICPWRSNQRPESYSNHIFLQLKFLIPINGGTAMTLYTLAYLFQGLPPSLCLSYDTMYSLELSKFQFTYLSLQKIISHHNSSEISYPKH